VVRFLPHASSRLAVCSLLLHSAKLRWVCDSSAQAIDVVTGTIGVPPTCRYDPNRPFLLSVENPDEPSLDVGRNAYNIVKVRKAFDHARRRLIGFVRQAQHKHKFRQGSLLRRCEHVFSVTRTHVCSGQALHWHVLSPWIRS